MDTEAVEVGAKLWLVQDAYNNKEAGGGANANSGTSYIPNQICATQCCNNEEECVRTELTSADMITKCGKCTGKQTKPF
jgi:hypothetical protein